MPPERPVQRVYRAGRRPNLGQDRKARTSTSTGAVREALSTGALSAQAAYSGGQRPTFELETSPFHPSAPVRPEPELTTDPELPTDFGVLHTVSGLCTFVIRRACQHLALTPRPGDPWDCRFRCGAREKG